MFASVRAGLIAALIGLASTGALAADKAFERAELADSATRLEAQIRQDVGKVGKPVATLRKEADAAFERRDFRTGMVILGQIVAAAPNDAAGWLRLARTLRQIQARDQRERALLLDRASTAAYVAYLRTSDKGEEAESLTLLGQALADRRQWRPALDAMRLALDLRESAELRAQYEKLRTEHGFRLLDYTVDSDATSPRACFQFSEELSGSGADLSPFVAVAGSDRPAIAASKKQLCIQGLKHGERYQIRLRAGLPSVVRETLAKTAEFTIFVRDRKPLARFAGKAYVLPRIGQQGIPVLSVNTDAVAISIYRIGDRNLLDTLLGGDFQRNLYPYYLEQLANDRGVKVWSGELQVERKLNEEVTTAFPVQRAVSDLKPGVYAMTARPKSALAEDGGQVATQWFIVSDLGLTAYSGDDGVHVVVHSLATTAPRDQVEVRLIARNNEVLATRRTNGAGIAHFEAGLARGQGGLAPAAIVVSEKADYAFLSLTGPAFDLTDRGVAGRLAPAGLDAFVFTERGVYRSGETVHITALLRDGLGNAAEGVPLTVVIERPDGVEYRRAATADRGLGGRSLSVAINPSASSGTWRVRAYVDPKRPPVGEATFLVEDYVPDRLEFDLKSPVTSIPREAPAQVSIEGRFLYGTPAAELALEGEVVIGKAKERDGYAGYVFGVSDEDIAAVQQPLDDLPRTDSDGKASFDLVLGKLPVTTRPLEARIAVRMVESGGRAVERTLTLPVAPKGEMIGVKPAFSGRALDDGADATFDIVMAAPDGGRLARKGLRYELLKVETHYQWYRQRGQWEYEPVKRTRLVADGRIDIAADRPARLALPVAWGRYRLEVSTGEPNGPLTSVNFDAGFYAEASADTPDLLEIALDKPEYRSGETMKVAVTARAAGRLTLNVFTDRLVASTAKEVDAGTANLELAVGKDWGTGAYLVATLRRPLNVNAGRMPGRAIGVQWFAIDRSPRTLSVDMKLPDTMRPDRTLSVPVKVAGLTAGEQARVVVAAVDVGILNLTGYKPPAPDDYFLGQRRLSAEIRDLYGQLIDGMQGVRGRIRTGGDGAGMEISGSPPAQAPLSLYSGIVTVSGDGVAEIGFDIPAFAGTVRVMAVAWSKDKVGKAVGNVVVRDPVVLTATLPHFLRTGDRGLIQLELANVEGPAGEYRVQVVSDGAIDKADGTAKSLTLAEKQRGRVQLPLSGSSAGPTVIRVSVTGPNDFTLHRSYALDTKPATQILARRTIRPIAPGESMTLSKDIFADFVPGTGRASISVAISAALDAANLLGALDRYPFGCSEQVTSRAIAMLYAKDLARPNDFALDGEIDQRIRDSIANLLARQDSTGSFGLWSVGGGDVWLDAYVTDFLSRARERNFAVPATAFSLALDRLRNYVATAPEASQNGGRELAYALYVLARNGQAPVGDLRYLADAKIDDVATPIGKAQIAAALALMGDKVRAQRVYDAALQSIAPQPNPDFGRSDYGSTLRDAAALVTLASESGASQPTIEKAVARIDTARGHSTHISTQEQAWLVRAASALSRQVGAISLNVGGIKRQGAFYRAMRENELNVPMTVTNTGDGAVQAVVSVSGAPLTPEPAAENGFRIERSYFTLGGEPADPSQAKQNQRFVVVLKVTEAEPRYGRIILADYLPAGFEIDNPRLVSSGDAGRLAWITDAALPAHSEFRDDRFSAAFNRKSEDPAVFAVAYVVRAVSPGRYVLPQAYIEDMYQPDRYGRTATGAVEITAAQ